MLYNICKKAAMLVPPIKRHVAYTRGLEKRICELERHIEVADSDARAFSQTIRAGTDG